MTTLALAVGIGATVLVALEIIVLRPLPFRDPGELVRITTVDPIYPQDPRRVSGIELAAWLDGAKTFVSVGGAEMPPRRSALIGDDTGSLLTLTPVSRHYFKTLGVEPARGSGFSSAVDDARWQIIISDRAWKRYFNSDANVIGRAAQFATLAGTWHVVGIMPEGFDYPSGTDIWQASRLVELSHRATRDRNFDVIGRLNQNTTVQQAQTELRLLSSQISGQYSTGQQGWTPVVEPLGRAAAKHYERTVFALTVAGLLVLISAATNIVNLIRTSISARRAELAVRLVMGASTWQVVRLCLTEVVLCFLAGWIGSWLLAGWMLSVASTVLPADIARLHELSAALMPSIGLRSAILAAVMLLCVGIVVFRHSNVRSMALTDYVRTGHYRQPARVQYGVLIGQIAPAVALTVIAVLVGKTLWTLQKQDFGFNPSRLLVAQLMITPDLAQWTRDATEARRRQRLIDGVHAFLAELRQKPGISGAEVINHRPFDENLLEYYFDSNNLPVQSSRDRAWAAALSVVSPGYFSVMEIRLLRGRLFTDADRLPETTSSLREVPRVVIVSESLARRLWGPEGGVDRRLGNDTVIGVVEDVRFEGLDEEPEPRLYYAYAQNPQISVSLFIRGDGVDELRTDLVVTARRYFGSDVRVFGFTTGSAIVRGWLRTQWLTATLIVALTAVTVVVALIGLFAVLAAVIQQRRREFGIRLALGAQPADIVQHTIKGVAAPTVLGLLIGAMVAIAVSRLLAQEFYGAAHLDSLTLAAALAVFVLAAACAAAHPLRSAAKVMPAALLRDVSRVSREERN